jgi:hypothetical protein
MADPAGESNGQVLRLDFDRRLMLQFRGSVVTSDAGLLAHRELDDALGLTTVAGEMLADARAGRNGRHAFVGLFRQSVFGRLAVNFGVSETRVSPEINARADQDRREGRQPRALCRFPDGRGRHSQKSLRRHLTNDRRTSTAAGSRIDVKRLIVLRPIKNQRRGASGNPYFRRSARQYPWLGCTRARAEELALPKSVESGNLGLNKAVIRWMSA